MHYIKSLITAAFLLFISFTVRVDAAEIPTGPRLKDLAGNMMIGSAFFGDWYSDVDRTIIQREHNAVQAVYYGAYGGWPAPGSYDFGDFNKTINWAVANDKQVVMHVLVGNNIYMPQWMINGNYSAGQLESLVDDFMKAIIQSNGNDTKVQMWNVVNEVCNLDGNGFEASILNNLGWEDDASGLTGSDQVVTRIPVFIRRAFEIARKYTTKDLELRDHSIEMHMTGYPPNTYKPKLFYQLCKHLLAKGTPMTAVGIQGHITIEPAWGENTWGDHGAWIKKLKALGLKVFITENTVQPSGLPLMANWDAFQKDKIFNMLKAERLAGIDGFFTWGMRCDADPSGYLRGQQAMPFSLNGDARPFYYGMQQALSETQAAHVATPSYSLAGGSYNSVQSVSLSSATSGAVIHYTIDGSTPTANSPTYVTALTIATTTVVRSLAVHADMTDSNLASATYTILLPPANSWSGSYFATSDFSGTPTVRTDATIDFDWGNGSPMAALPVDNFTVRWSGTVTPVFTETYTFTATSDDGIRVWVGGTLVIDRWVDQAPTASTGQKSLSANTPVQVVVEYYEHGGGAVARLEWQSSSQGRQVVPASAPSTGNQLPAGWTAADVSTPGANGSTTVNNGTWTVVGSGADIWNAADEFQFVSMPVTGDVRITAKVVSETNTNEWAKAGVMVRESTATGSRHAFTCITAAHGAAFQRRVTENGPSTHTAGTLSPAPYWVRLERLGTTCIGSVSPDGVTWTEIRRETIAIPNQARVGLAVTSHVHGTSCTAVFTNVEVISAPAAAN